jgi:hypothetical protein
VNTSINKKDEGWTCWPLATPVAEMGESWFETSLGKKVESVRYG